MNHTISEKLLELGVDLLTPATPVANYVGFVQTGNLIFTSGQLPLKDGQFVATGLLGRDLDVESGQLAAKWCAINILAQVRSALGDLERIGRLVKITVFVAASPDFSEHHLVANGASDFFAEALGERASHCRSAVGVSSLPMNAPVEIEATIEIA